MRGIKSTICNHSEGGGVCVCGGGGGGEVTHTEVTHTESMYLEIVNTNIT